MPARILLAGLSFALALAVLGRSDDDAKKADETAVCDLSMELQALRLLRQLKLNDDQMKALQKIAKETAQPMRERKGKASKEYLEKQQELRAALIDGSDDERIDELQDKLDELGDDQKPELDDGVETTDAARRLAPQVMRRLKANQVAAYIAKVADDVGDPLEKLLEALEIVRTLKPNEWREQRDGILDDVSHLVAGVDEEKAARVSDQVLALLSRVRLLTDNEFKDQHPELEKSARQIVGDIGPTDVLRNLVERTLTELLSNPRLAAALKDLLK